MKRSQEKALSGRPFALESLKLLRNISEHTRKNHLLFQKPKTIKRICCLVVTTNKGLCGGLNANVFSLAEKYIQKQKQLGRKIDLMVFGKKGEDFFKKREYCLLENKYLVGDEIFLSDIRPVAKDIIKWFLEKKYDSVQIIYSDFLSTFQQEAVKRQILPVEVGKIEEIIQKYLKNVQNQAKVDKSNRKHYYRYKIEPSEKDVLDVLFDNLIRIFLYQAFVESRASEHSARMMAMKNASDNADEIIKKLNLEYNKIRQSKITQEIAEVSAAAL